MDATHGSAGSRSEATRGVPEIFEAEDVASQCVIHGLAELPVSQPTGDVDEGPRDSCDRDAAVDGLVRVEERSGSMTDDAVESLVPPRGATTSRPASATCFKRRNRPAVP